MSSPTWSSTPPTEAGWYHLRAHDGYGGWSIVAVEEDMGVLWAAGVEVACYEGERWGPRIPSPEELAAMREALEKCDRALDLRKQLERYLGAGEHATLDPWTVVQAENAARAALRKLEEARDE